MKTERPVLFRHQLAYGGVTCWVAGHWLSPVSGYFTFTPPLWSDTAAGFGYFSVASIIDAISNPLMGYISDNFGKTRLGKRFGRRRFFILLGIP